MTKEIKLSYTMIAYDHENRVQCWISLPVIPDKSSPFTLEEVTRAVNRKRSMGLRSPFESIDLDIRDIRPTPSVNPFPYHPRQRGRPPGAKADK